MGAIADGLKVLKGKLDAAGTLVAKLDKLEGSMKSVASSYQQKQKAAAAASVALGKLITQLAAAIPKNGPLDDSRNAAKDALQLLRAQQVPDKRTMEKILAAKNITGLKVPSGLQSAYKALDDAAKAVYEVGQEYVKQRQAATVSLNLTIVQLQALEAESQRLRQTIEAMKNPKSADLVSERID